MSQSISRRRFFEIGAVTAAIAGTGLTGCSAGKPKTVEESASAATDWLGTAPEIADDEIIETVETEILVCGAGTSGLFTACAAAEEGAKVVCLERAPLAVASGTTWARSTAACRRKRAKKSTRTKSSTT